MRQAERMAGCASAPTGAAIAAATAQFPCYSGDHSIGTGSSDMFALLAGGGGVRAGWGEGATSLNVAVCCERGGELFAFLLHWM
jgi:hypothetical protein